MASDADELIDAAGGPLGRRAPRRRPRRGTRSSTARSYASGEVASNPTNEASLAGPPVTEQAVDPLVVPPGGGAIRRRLAGDEPDDVGEELAERGRIGDFETEVGEFEIDVHAARSFAMNPVRIVPIPSIVETSSSPGARNRGGVRVPPTPAGVPVKMRSPGSNGVTDDRDGSTRRRRR